MSKLIRSGTSTISRHYPFCNHRLLTVFTQTQEHAKQFALRSNHTILTLTATINHAEIKQTLTSFLLPIAIETAVNLFKSQDFRELTNFQTKLREKIDSTSEAIISFLSNIDKSKKSIIFIINRIKNLPLPIHYLDELKNSLPFVEDIENVNITQDIKKIAEKTLLQSCANYFLTAQTQRHIESRIKADVAIKLAELDLDPENHHQTIHRLAYTLTAKILVIDTIKKTIDFAKNQSSATQACNLLQITENLLIQSLNENIKNFIKNNFFYAITHAILKKIDMRKKLTADEIAHLSPIQYTDTLEEFYGGLANTRLQ